MTLKTATRNINYFVIQLHRLTTVHLFISVALLSVLICSICLVIQYVIRYHKYNLAQASDDEDYPYYSSAEYTKKYSKKPGSAATSTSTLLSEAVSVQKCKDISPNINVKKKSEVESRQSDTKHLKSEKKVIICEEEGFEKEVQPSDEPSSEATSLPTITEDSRHENITASTSTISESTLTGSVTSPASSLNELSEKQRKECHRERMLHIIGSDLSLTGQDTDLEMDYYDYNVHNTSDVPGSYIGMDPAFCVWIPPFAPKLWDQGELIQDTDLTEYKCKQFRNDSGNVTPVNERDTDVSSNRLSTISNDTVLTLCEKSDGVMRSGYDKNDNPLLDNDGVRDALLPDSPVRVHQAVIKKKEAVAMELADIRFVDDDDDLDEAISPL